MDFKLKIKLPDIDIRITGLHPFWPAVIVAAVAAAMTLIAIYC